MERSHSSNIVLHTLHLNSVISKATSHFTRSQHTQVHSLLEFLRDGVQAREECLEMYCRKETSRTCPGNSMDPTQSSVSAN